MADQSFDVRCAHCGETTTVKLTMTWGGGGGDQRDVPVLGTTPVTVGTDRDLKWDSGSVDPLAHLSPADRESARRLNEALVEDDGRETPAAGRYFADWIWPKRL